jgi:hypothetical protein
VGDDPVPLAIQGRERFLRRLLQAGGLRLLLALGVDYPGRVIPRRVRLLQPFPGGRFLPPGGCRAILPGRRQLVMGTVKSPEPVQPLLRPVPQLLRVRVARPDKMAPDVSKTVEIDQAPALFPADWYTA